MKFDVTQFIKDVGEVIKDKLSPLEVQVKQFEDTIKDFEPFDNSENEKKFEDINKGFESIEPFDDTSLRDLYKGFRDEFEEETKQLEKSVNAIKPFDNSENEKKFDAIKPFDNSENEKIFSKLAKFMSVDPTNPQSLNQLLSDIKNSIPTIPEIPAAYDDAELKKEMMGYVQDKVAAVKKSIPAAYDDGSLKEMLENFSKKNHARLEKLESVKPYNDSSLKDDIFNFAKKYGDRLNEFEDGFRSLKIPAAYDDTKLQKKFEAFSKGLHLDGERIEKLEKIEIPKEFNDRELQKQIDGIKTLFEKTSAEIKEKAHTIIKVEASTTKHWDGQEADRGVMILHENSLYLNLLAGNGSVPSIENKSYQLLIKAPKELNHKGLYVEGDVYEKGDMVMKDNATWFKTSEPEQNIPSKGWKLMAKAVRGKKGDQGDQGDTIVVEGYEKVIQELHDAVAILKSQVKGLQNGTD